MSLRFPRMQRTSELRRELRRRRRNLDAAEQAAHSRDCAALCSTLALFRRSRNIAVYLAADGELDLSILLADAEHKRWYLPVLRPRPYIKLWFALYRPGQHLVENRFHIPEPPLKHRLTRPPWSLDLILMPLVGFDARCNRLGMGGGFYDRTLAYLRHRKHWHKPLLVGVAHECQRVAELPVREWDVPLDYVITESRVYRRAGE